MMEIKSVINYCIFLLYWVNSIRASTCFQEVQYIQPIHQIQMPYRFLEDRNYEEPEEFDPPEHALLWAHLMKNTNKNVTIICELVSMVDGIPYRIQDKKDVQTLEIIKSTISTLPVDAFSNFTKLSKLYLRNISIEIILPGAFNGLIDLRELHLDHNAITEISTGVLNSLDHLEVLYLSYNRINRIEENALLGVLNLKNIHLNSNNLVEFKHDSLFKTLKIEVLDLSNNPIARDIQNLSFTSNLQVLLINNVSLLNFDWDLSNYTLEKLTLAFNQLKSVDVNKFPRSNILDLSNNRIIFISNWQLFECTDLNFAHNRIEKIGELYNNSLQTVSLHLSTGFNSLQSLDFSHNFIANIEPDAFENLNDLRRLYLGYNNLTVVRMCIFRNLSHLNYLDLAQNRINHLQFGAFDNLQSLQMLNISGNHLTVLNPYSFSSNSELTQLHFDDNQINSWSMDNAVKVLKKLSWVSLKGNNWNCEDLAKILYESHQLHVSISRGDSYDRENLQGIGCLNTKSEDSTNQLQDFFNNDFQNSKFYRYFNGGYINSSFFKFFDNYRHHTDFEKNYMAKLQHNIEEHPLNKGSTIEFITIAVMQAVIVGILLVGIFSVFYLTNLLKKHLSHRPSSSSSLQLM